ncbi:MAG: hypothetical protein RIM99_01745 [Cyclobacteriaceae bacterium]
MESPEKYSAYKVKGTAIINSKKFIDEQIRPGFFDERMKELDPQYTKLLLPSTWYSAFNSKLMADIAAKELGWELKKYCFTLNVVSVNHSMTTIYAFFLKIGGPVMVLGKTPQMVKTFTNSVEYEVIKNEKGDHEAIISSPAFFAEWNEYMIFGGMYGILKALNRTVKSHKVLAKEKYDGSDGPWEKRTISITYD